MPTTALPECQDLYHVMKNGIERVAEILRHSENQVYVHYMDSDKRMDEWVPKEECRKMTASSLCDVLVGNAENHAVNVDRFTDQTGECGMGSRKRKRGGPAGRRMMREAEQLHMQLQHCKMYPGDGFSRVGDNGSTHQKRITEQRNFDKVHFGEWQVKTWYYSPYPLTDVEEDFLSPSIVMQPRIPGVHKASIKSHGRTSDLLAGGLGRFQAGVEMPALWVCQQCFKYMADGTSYGLHLRYCNVDSPPGDVVYQKGALMIWEVDGAKEKLYCQNLALFGKLFIDVKTLFFDTDNFLFYILTDADGSQHDHMLGFFSKEKVSYDDYNLACIMTLPPYQRKGYGMLMIEFSYELSRRAGKIGTPERPLSDLGLRSYLSYWVSTLVRFFRRVLSVLPADTPMLTTNNDFPDLLRSSSADHYGPQSRDNSGNGIYANDCMINFVRKNTKGWAGELVDDRHESYSFPIENPIFSSERVFYTEMDEDGAAVTHAAIKCTLSDISEATQLRVEDAAFALNECGLLMQSFGEAREDHVVVITRRLVEKVAKERKVKKPYMCPGFVKIL